MGTAARLMTNPPFADMLSNFPIWPQIDQPTTNISLDASPYVIPPTTWKPASASGHSSQRSCEPKQKPRGRLLGTTTVARS